MRPVGLRGGGRRECWRRVIVSGVGEQTHRGHAQLALLALLPATHATPAGGHPVHGRLVAGSVQTEQGSDPSDGRTACLAEVKGRFSSLTKHSNSNSMASRRHRNSVQFKVFV